MPARGDALKSASRRVLGSVDREMTRERRRLRLLGRYARLFDDAARVDPEADLGRDRALAADMIAAARARLARLRDLREEAAARFVARALGTGKQDELEAWLRGDRGTAHDAEVSTETPVPATVTPPTDADLHHAARELVARLARLRNALDAS